MSASEQDLAARLRKEEEAAARQAARELRGRITEDDFLQLPMLRYSKVAGQYNKHGPANIQEYKQQEQALLIKLLTKQKISPKERKAYSKAANKAATAERYYQQAKKHWQDMSANQQKSYVEKPFTGAAPSFVQLLVPEKIVPSDDMDLLTQMDAERKELRGGARFLYGLMGGASCLVGSLVWLLTGTQVSWPLALGTGYLYNAGLVSGPTMLSIGYDSPSALQIPLSNSVFDKLALSTVMPKTAQSVSSARESKDDSELSARTQDLAAAMVRVQDHSLHRRTSSLPAGWNFVAKSASGSSEGLLGYLEKSQGASKEQWEVRKKEGGGYEFYNSTTQQTTETPPGGIKSEVIEAIARPVSAAFNASQG